MTRCDEPRLRGIGVSSEMRRCLECGREQRIPRNRWGTFKFCSRRCGYRWNAKHNQIEVSCRICDRKFRVIAHRSKTAKYCSRRCYYRAMHLKGSVIVKCRHCGAEFRASPSQKRIYCGRACVNKASRSIWNPAFTTIRKNLEKRGEIIACEQCGFSSVPEILGVHHKDHDRTNNTRTNLAILCPTCHSIEHRKHIPH